MKLALIITAATLGYVGVCCAIGAWLKHCAVELPDHPYVTVVWRNPDSPTVSYAVNGTITALDEFHILVSDDDNEPVIIDTRLIRSIL